MEKIIKPENNEIEKFEIKATLDMVEENFIIKDQLKPKTKMSIAFQTDIKKKTREINNFIKDVTDLQEEL